MTLTPRGASDVPDESETPEDQHWPDGQVRPEAPYRCGAFEVSSMRQCVLLSDHDGAHVLEPVNLLATLYAAFDEVADWERRCATGDFRDVSAERNLEESRHELNAAKAALEHHLAALTTRSAALEAENVELIALCLTDFNAKSAVDALGEANE